MNDSQGISIDQMFSAANVDQIEAEQKLPNTK